VYLANLRRKLEPDPTRPDPARPRYLITEPGVGYRFTP
jgi:two-component system KDP operon response regulator KdpE